MLSYRPITNLRSLSDKKNFYPLINALKEELLTDEDLTERYGVICGCAIYFSIEEKEYVSYLGLKSDHGDVLENILDNTDISVSLIDDENTLFGFITDKNYFLDRRVAAIIHKQFLINLGNVRAADNIKGRLHSFEVSWADCAMSIPDSDL